MTPPASRPALAAHVLLDRLQAGDRAALARFVTALEAGEGAARALVCQLYRHRGQGHVVGISGPPGVGKSTLVGALVRGWRQRGESVAVLAVDPSSPRTGGALLGDRVRLPDFSADAGVFVRSMATHGRVGGLAHATLDVLLALDAFGFQILVVETVGTGQDEVEITRIADTTVVVTAPGLGDGLQATKAGLQEVADLLVVNKADLPGADQAVADLLSALRLGAPQDWQPPVLRVTARSGAGVPALLDALAGHRDFLRRACRERAVRQARASYHLRSIVESYLRSALEETAASAAWSEQAGNVAAGVSDPYAVARQVTRQILVDRHAPA